MLEFYFTDKRTLGLFNQGPLGPCFDGFATHLRKLGYHPVVAQVLEVLGPFALPELLEGRPGGMVLLLDAAHVAPAILKEWAWHS